MSPANDNAEPDFAVENYGSIVLVRALTQAAADWLLENAEPGATWIGAYGPGGAVAVEPRYVDDLVAGMEEAGLVGELR